MGIQIDIENGCFFQREVSRRTVKKGNKVRAVITFEINDFASIKIHIIKWNGIVSKYELKEKRITNHDSTP